MNNCYNYSVWRIWCDRYDMSAPVINHQNPQIKDIKQSLLNKIFLVYAEYNLLHLPKYSPNIRKLPDAGSVSPGCDSEQARHWHLTDVIVMTLLSCVVPTRMTKYGSCVIYDSPDCFYKGTHMGRAYSISPKLPQLPSSWTLLSFNFTPKSFQRWLQLRSTVLLFLLAPKQLWLLRRRLVYSMRLSPSTLLLPNTRAQSSWSYSLSDRSLFWLVLPVSLIWQLAKYSL